MSPLAVCGLGAAVLVALIFLRVPVAVALGLVGYVAYALIEGLDRANSAVGAAPIDLASAYTFSVVPLFALMGAVAAVSGLSSDLFRASQVMLRRVPGSLAIASIFASAMFGAVCGSSVATAMTMSKVSIPQMLRAGYAPSLAAGAVAAGGTLGILIPPSLILMIYAIIAQQSIVKLFAAALIPGLVLTVLYSLVALILYLRVKSASPVTEPAEREPLLRALARIWHVVALFALTLGGIYTGWFTPTEAAAVGAIGALLLGAILGRLSWGHALNCFTETVRLVSSVIFVVLASAIFSYFIVQTGISREIVSTMTSHGLGPIQVILLLCLLYIVMGCFLEGIALVLITVPITLPLATSFGYDPIWFGVFLTILVEVGLIHPPLGMNLFVIKSVNPELSTLDIYRGAFPFLAAPLVLIALMIIFPQLVLWLPSLTR